MLVFFVCFFLITFPWKASHSGAHPPLGTGVGAIVVLTKLLLLLQMEGSSRPQLMSFQYPKFSELVERSGKGKLSCIPNQHIIKYFHRLTHAFVDCHTVFIIVCKVGFIVFPRSVSYRCPIQPTKNVRGIYLKC